MSEYRLRTATTAYTFDKFRAELLSLYRILLKDVYLKSSKEVEIECGKFDEDIKSIWDETALTPKRYVASRLNPSFATNRVIRGQKAREKRWDKFAKSHLNLNS